MEIQRQLCVARNELKNIRCIWHQYFLFNSLLQSSGGRGMTPPKFFASSFTDQWPVWISWNISDVNKG